MSVIYLVCEGTASDLDLAALEPLMEKLCESHDLVVEPAGGWEQIAAVAMYLRDREKGSRVLSVRDRDFDLSREEADARWQSGSDALAWRRFEIENYLLDPRVVGDTLRAISGGPKIRWPASLNAVLDDPIGVLAEVASGWLDHYAGQRCQKWLWSQHRDVASRLDDMGDVTHPPWGEGKWAAWLDDRARGLLSNFAPLVADPEAEVARTLTKLREFTQAARDPAFIASGAFLIDMPGKELLRALMDWLSRKGVSGMDSNDLGRYLVDSLVNAYTPGFFAPTDDFAELAARFR